MTVEARLRQRVANGMYEPEEATWLECLLEVARLAKPLRDCTNLVTIEERFPSGTFDQYRQIRCHQCPNCLLHLALRALEIPVPESE